MAGTPAAWMTSTTAPTRLVRALSRAMVTARTSISLASAGRRRALAAAMASTPVPVPMSSAMARLGRLRGAVAPPLASRLRRRAFTIRSSASRQPRVVPWWPVPNASAASISMPIRLARTRARSCAPCTTKRPASTGPRPARLLPTQSVGASVANTSAWAAALPAADAINARTIASSGRWRKWMASDQRPGASSKAEAANCSAARLSASASTIFCAVEASLESRATTVAMGEGSGMAQLLRPIPDIRRRLSRARIFHKMVNKDGRSAGTVAALAEVYLRLIQGLRSVGQIERRLRKDALPIIGHIQLHELHRRDVTRVIDAKFLDAPITARRVFEDIRAMVRWSVARGDLDHNPIDGMKRPPISKPRTRVLSDDEISTLWVRLDEFKPEVARVIKLCLITGQRVGEVAGMSKGELDLARKVWNIPGSSTKNGHPHSVPLSQLALDIINQAPSRLSAGNISCAIYYNQFGLARRWTAHDIRRTVLTKMAELGIAPIVLGHVANHRTTTKAGITLGVYVQHAYEREKRAALELWASRLQGIIDGGANVVAMRRGGN